MVDGLGQGVSGDIYTSGLQLAQRSQPVVVALGHAEAQTGSAPVSQPLAQTARRPPVQQVAHASVGPAELSAHHQAPGELELGQVAFELSHVVGVELGQEHRAQTGEGGGAHHRPELFRQASQTDEVPEEHFHGLDGAVAEVFGCRVQAPEDLLAVSVQGFGGQGIQLLGELRVGAAVGQGALAPNDLVRTG